MKWILRPPLILGWFESLPYRLGTPRRDRESVRSERLKYWDIKVAIRSPKAQLYGFLTGLILWVLVTFVGILPLLGWLIRLGAPVPGALFGAVLLLPFVMLLYIGILIPLAPIKSRSVGWIVALSWPAEMVVALMVGTVSRLAW